MKKTEIKDSLNHITPDCHLKTRLKANVEAYTQKQPKKQNKLAFTTAAICCALIITGIGAGISLVGENETTGSISYKHAEAQTDESTSVTKGVDGVFVSNPSWINNVTENIDTSDTKLIVNGKNIASESYIKFSLEEESAEISLTAVLIELGAEIKWGNKSFATVSLNGSLYILDAEHKTFSERTSEQNLFADPDGMCLVKAKTVNDQYVIDNRSMENLINNLDYSFAIDYENKTITIS